MSEISALTAAERQELVDHENKIDHKFWEIGDALAAIRDKKLYRETHRTFEDYCFQRWSFKDSRARQLIAGAEVHHQLEGVTGVTLDNEQQARAVNSLHESVRADAVTNVVASNQKLTALSIKEEGKKLEAERTPDQQARDAVYASKCAPIIQKMKLGVLTSQNAMLLWDAIKACKPTVRGDMLRLNVVDASVIRMLNERHKSETYKELSTVGCIQFNNERVYKADQLTPQILREYLDERFREHRSKGHTDSNVKKGVEIVPANIYRGDPVQTADVLWRELDVNEIAQVIEYLQTKLKAAAKTAA